jgi:glycosyltransferase involved in cell wall biosynthesis
VIPTLQDEIGQLVAMEAMSCGSVVVVSDIGAFREQLAGVAVLFAPGDDKALADALAGLARDPDDVRMRSRAGRRRVEERFDVAEMNRRYQSLFARFSEPG